MNIADLPQELFEYHIFNDLYPHCNLINSYIKFNNVTIDDGKHYYNVLTNNDIRLIMSNQLCFYNNKSLLIFYKYCSYINLNKILHYTVCNNCVLFNYFNTLKWAYAKKYYCHIKKYIYIVSIQDNHISIHHICLYAMKFDRLHMLKWISNVFYNNSYKILCSTFDIYHFTALYQCISILKFVIKNKLLCDFDSITISNQTYYGIYINKKIFKLLQTIKN